MFSHDLGVAEMFLAVRKHRPQDVIRWIDEHRLAPLRRDCVSNVRESDFPTRSGNPRHANADPYLLFWAKTAT